MKKITILFLGIIFTFSLTAQNIDEILQSHYEVMGYDQMKEINSMIFTGITSSQGMEKQVYHDHAQARSLSP